ncbi:tubulin-like doman-containing protein [Nocardioides sp. URHA0032]|uniref:tubulin-like doman-containing protein n=1 Tax=Nocardioides sp. URHA0032 TaxID=1380388 RepID=UPI000A84574A|nr:tubulin-like doman-containing protein [Nocardioides sp. URHA0032]
MKKFLVVGCGGSGGATLRFAMDQLRADLRTHGIDAIPPAWQFVHIDVNPTPESTPGLGSVVDLGGRYKSVSSPGNMYSLVANNIESSLGAKQELRSLLGWAPMPKADASAVNVISGAGQNRAVGRMLTLTRLKELQAEMGRAWEQLQRPDAWGDLPARYPEGGPYETNSYVIPIVVGSMAGGSGAAMFLDVCRLLGRVPGMSRSELGVFLFTSDVFNSLDEALRMGIDGNATGAMGDLIAAQTRAADAVDAELLSALGLPPETVDEPPFKRVIPIGAAIGGDGAKFGDGTMEGVYRGLGRALAATIGSEAAAGQYVKSKLENTTAPPMDRASLGWGVDPTAFAWGSFGYASLSLGRDRYAEYASQRLARNAVDRLVRGYRAQQSQLPAEEQLKQRVASDWPLIVDRLMFPQRDESVRGWFLSDRALSSQTVRAEAQQAISAALLDVGSIPPSQAPAFVETVRTRLGYHQADAKQRINAATYAWGEAWATTLEKRAREEFVRSMTAAGLPYARDVMRKLASHLTPVIEELRRANPDDAPPLVMDNSVAAQAAGLKKTLVSSGHALVEAITVGLLGGASRAVELSAARLAADVLATFAHDVLGGLEAAATNALINLEAAERETTTEAGLAQLETAIYSEWPAESAVVPSRFDHADNEVLLTTSKDFPEQFAQDVAATVVSAGGIYHTALSEIVSSIVAGKWESAGGQPGDIEVLSTQVVWRSAALPKAAATQVPTPKQQPVYRVAASASEVLDRARAFQQRPGEKFEEFSSETFDDFLNDMSEPDSERARRLDLFVQKFTEARLLARPLVGVSPSMIGKVHSGASLSYEYSFGTVPLEDSSAAAQRLIASLEQDPSIGVPAVTNFKSALRGTSKANRIAMFGSYPTYSPLVFSSLLDQVQRSWAGSQEHALRMLWRWRRTRPLPGALAMGASEQRAMIKGWFIGRMLGMVEVPTDTSSPDPVQVFSSATHTWIPFATRQMTARDRYRGADDWLPGVLEGHTLALINCNNDVQLSALRPYVALRGIADDSLSEPFVAYDGSSGDRLIAAWVSSGTWPTGRPPTVDSLAAAGSADVASRVDAASTWLAAVREYVAAQYLSEGGGVGALAVKRTRVPDVAALERAPMFAEIAEVVDSVLEEIEASVQNAAAAAGGRPTMGDSRVARPDF